MARKKTEKVNLALKLKVTSGGKGVLAKDGKTPWAPSTISGVRMAPGRPGFGDGEPSAMMSPYSYHPMTLLHLLCDPSIIEVMVIDANNNEYIVKIERN